MRLIFTCLFVCATLAFLAAQPASQGADMIILKSGEVLRGTIEEYQPGIKLVLRTDDGSIRELPTQAIERIRQGEADASTVPDEVAPVRSTPLEWNEDAEYVVVRLLDGQSYQGKIVEYQRGAYLTLELDGGTLLVFSELEIDDVGTLDEGGTFRSIAVRSQGKARPVYAFPERGLFHHAAFTFSFGQRPLDPREPVVIDPFFPEEIPSRRNAVGFNVQYVAGFQFNRLLGLGAGVSYDGYNLQDGESVVSFFAHYRGYLTRSIVAPYLSLYTGYGLALRNASQGITEAKGGLMIHPELGFRLGANDRTNFTVGLGYRFQQASYTQVFEFNGDIQYRDITYKRLMFSMGLIF